MIEVVCPREGKPCEQRIDSQIRILPWSFSRPLAFRSLFRNLLSPSTARHRQHNFLLSVNLQDVAVSIPLLTKPAKPSSHEGGKLWEEISTKESSCIAPTCLEEAASKVRRPRTQLGSEMHTFHFRLRLAVFSTRSATIISRQRPTSNSPKRPHLHAPPLDFRHSVLSHCETADMIEAAAENQHCKDSRRFRERQESDLPVVRFSPFD